MRDLFRDRPNGYIESIKREELHRPHFGYGRRFGYRGQWPDGLW